MKLLISIIGNICTGKSAVCRQLHKQLNIPYFSIDEYRRMHNAHTIDSEWRAWDELINDISHEYTAILESSGTSVNLEDIYGKFDKVVVIKLSAPSDEIAQRFAERVSDPDYIPVPFFGRKDNEKLTDIVARMEYKLQDVHADYIMQNSKGNLHFTVIKIQAIYYKLQKSRRLK